MATIKLTNNNDVHTDNNLGNTIYAYGGQDIVYGRGGDDLIYGGHGNDYLFGEDGDDAVHGEDGDDYIGGGNGNDYLRGGNGHDTIYGEAGDDRMFGDAGNDLLSGGHGRDTISGGDGHDTIIGGMQADHLTGGAGANVFRYTHQVDSNEQYGYDTITDFQKGMDKVDLSRLDAVFGVSGKQSFQFVEFAKSGGAGTVTYHQDGWILAESDGQYGWDMVIRTGANLNLTASDFIV